MYSTPGKVISYTGVRPQDFYLEDGEEKTAEEKLEELIEGWLLQIKDLIDADRGREYKEDIPPGIENIALRMAANMVAQAQLRRETPIVRHDDYSVDMVEDKVMTNAIKNDLARFPFKFKVKLMNTGTYKED